MSGLLLITGASGFIGEHLARHLLERGEQVRLLVRDPTRIADDLRTACELVKGDLTQPHSLGPAARGVALVYHCAANVSTWDSDAAYLAVNRDGVANLVRAIAAESPDLKRLVHVSSVDVYGFPRQAATEDSPLEPGAFGYGASKVAGETVLQTLCGELRLPCTIVRPCNVIGPGSPFVERIGRELDNGLMLTIDGGRANAGLIDVGNLVRYLACLGESEQARGGIFNVRDGYDADWDTFIRRLRKDIEGRGRVIDLPYPLAETIAKAFAGTSRFLRLRSEPLLHPLLVRIFGRTCGHDASRLHALCPLPDAINFDQAMQRSAQWYRATIQSP